MADEQIEKNTEGTVTAVWKCDSCGRAFRLNKRETLVHTAETGHNSFHAESYIVNATGRRNIVITKIGDGNVNGKQE
jgi:hypothetical protein